MYLIVQINSIRNKTIFFFHNPHFTIPSLLLTVSNFEIDKKERLSANRACQKRKKGRSSQGFTGWRN